jgi:D-psicose/D-tagatose/L-ribulose 3-epimerase
MQLGLINSAWVQANQPLLFGIQQTKALGFDSIDLFVDPLDLHIRDRRLIKQACDDLDLPIISLACVALGLGDFNPSVQRFHQQRVRQYLELAYEYQARNVLLVLGEYLWNQEVIKPADQWQIAVEQVQQLGQYATELGLQIAIELEPFRLSLVNDIESMVRFLEDVAVPAVQANIDISHLVLSKVAPTELRRLQDRACHVHLSDCDGQVHGDLPPGRGVVDFVPYLQEIKALQIDGAISIELEYSPEPDKIVEWVSEAYTKTAALLAQVGLRG